MHEHSLLSNPSTIGHPLLREPIAFTAGPTGRQAALREPEALPQARGSRRRRLWEISAHCHCTVIGLCLPIAALRRLLDRAGGTPPGADDYEAHVAAVSAAARRGPVGEAMQKDLEQRHAVAVRRFNAAKSSEALIALWDEQVGRGDTAGALWAALTHPRCDPDTEEALHRRAHMLQHQAGAGGRADAARIAALTAEHAALTDALARARERYRQAQAGQSTGHAAMTTEIGRLRAELAARDALIASQREALDRVRGDTDAAAARAALEDRIATLTERNRELLARLSAAGPSGSGSPAAAPGGGGSAPSAGEAAAPTEASAKAPAKAAPGPDTRAVLCVGGLHRAVAVYREIVEKRGGRFIHHDGGREDSVHRLEANLAAADLVVCQASCISHGAYWQVKDHCKRTGKRCIYLDKPSASALSRSLAESRAAAPAV